MLDGIRKSCVLAQCTSQWTSVRSRRPTAQSQPITVSQFSKTWFDRASSETNSLSLLLLALFLLQEHKSFAFRSTDSIFTLVYIRIHIILSNRTRTVVKMNIKLILIFALCVLFSCAFAEEQKESQWDKIGSKICE